MVNLDGYGYILVIMVNTGNGRMEMAMRSCVCVLCHPFMLLHSPYRPLMKTNSNVFVDDAYLHEHISSPLIEEA